MWSQVEQALACSECLSIDYTCRSGILSNEWNMYVTHIRPLLATLSVWILTFVTSAASANCDALLDYPELKPGRGPAVIRMPSEVLGPPRQVIIDSESGIDAERRITVGGTIIRLAPRTSTLIATTGVGVLHFTLDVFPIPTRSLNDLTRNPGAEQTFDLLDGRGGFALFRLPYQSAEYQHLMRYFVVDQAGNICRPYLENANWTVMKRGIRESSAPAVQLQRSERRLPQQVLALAKIGTAIEVEWREIGNNSTSQLKGRRTLDRDMRNPIEIGPFRFEIKTVETEAIIIQERAAKPGGW